MKTLLATGAALGLVMAATPATAQSTMNDTMATSSTELSATQQATYDGWPAERQASYDGWPAEAQSYFWTLNSDQVRGWWLLNDEQRVQILGMAPEQRAAAWTAIMNQMAGATAMPATETTASARATTAPRAANTTTGNIQYRSTERVQATPGDQGPPTGEISICSANEQDNCINAWEAGERGPGVNRPLDYWPGQPASEM